MWGGEAGTAHSFRHRSSLLRMSLSFEIKVRQLGVWVARLVTAAACRLVRTTGMALTVMAVAAMLSLSPGAVAADALQEYEQSNARLEQLAEQRGAIEARLANAMAAERAALVRLSSAEAALRTLIAARAEVAARQVVITQEVDAANAAAVAMDEARGQLERRVQAQEAWLFETAAPLSQSMHGYATALRALEAVPAAEAATQDKWIKAREAQAGNAARLGQLTSEITASERQADTFARQVGMNRAAALSASSALVQLQRSGDALVAQVSAQFTALREAGHPVGVARISLDVDPISEPALWNSAMPPVYTMPAGATAVHLRADGPLLANKHRLAAASVVDGGAVAPPSWISPIAGHITTRFGDGTPYQAAHWALDIGTSLYTPVLASADGVVEFAGLAVANERLASYGAVVLLRHDDHFTSLYAHLDDRAHGLVVQVGSTVKQGQIIGYVGLSGYTTGPHLHFEVRVDNQPVDPLLLVAP